MLYLIATPIGNLEDITLRAIRVLKEADYVLAEDTRKTGFLLKNLGIEKPLVSFFEHNEHKRINAVVADLEAGKNIALVSDSGTPTISDPGYKLIVQCRAKSIPVTAIPGPSSIINVLALSSLPHEKFIFLGYLPRKDHARRKLLEAMKQGDITFVFLESPFRVEKSLADIRDIFEQGRVTIGREMTKKFEEIWEGTAGDACTHFSHKKPRGEFTVVVSGRSEERSQGEAEIA